MELLNLQRRLVEVGRIRLGEKRTSSRGKTYPAKLATFRLTSRDRKRLDAVAELYGGTVTEWEGEWQVTTEADALDIAVVPGQALNQAYELWGQKRPKKAGDKTPNPVVCLRRCDGTTEHITDKPCVCSTEEEMQCKPTTRLSVVLTRIPGLGVWRLESRGWNAAMELAGSVQLLESLIASRRPVRARLRLDKREQQTESETRKFVVPVIDIDHTIDQVLESLGAGATPNGGALPSAPGLTPVPALPEGPQPSVAEQVSTVGEGGPGRPRANAAEPIPSTGMKPRARGAVPVEESGSDADGGTTAPAPDGGGASAPVAAGSSASPPPTSPGEAAEDPRVAASRAREIAMWCRDAGLDDDGRHAFLAAFSQGAYASAKQVSVADLAGIRAATVKLKRGELRLEERDGRFQLVDPRFGWESTRPGAPVSGDDVDEAEVIEEAGQERDQAYWLRQVENVPGIGQAKLLKKARELAPGFDVEAPTDLDHVTDERLGVALLKWLREQQAA